MRLGLLLMGLFLISLISSTPALGWEATQTTWAGGVGTASPVTAWEDSFATASEVSWCAVPGQVALSSNLLVAPAKTTMAEGLDGAYGLYVDDFEGDGDLDVFMTAETMGLVAIFFNQGGSPPVWDPQAVDLAYLGGTSIHPADIDDDGDTDIVCAAEHGGNNVSWWRNDGGSPITWTKFVIDPAVAVACNCFVADVDGDEALDVLATSWSGAFLAWWRNEGGSPITWTKYTIKTGFSGAHSPWAEDIDGDGDTDIVGTAALLNDIVLFLNNGDDPITWTEQLIGGSFGGVRYASMGDVDADGRKDIIAAGFDNHLAWWRNEGGEPITWTRQTVDNLCYGGHYCRLADCNGDGLQDIVAVAYELNSICWYESDGASPITWTKHVIEDTFADALTAFPGDLDGDGDLEIVGTSHVGALAYWELTEFATAGELESLVLDTRGAPEAASLDWTAAAPAGTSLHFLFRSSEDPLDLGAWSAPITTPGDLTGPLGRYCQYKVVLGTSEVTLSPLLYQVDFAWSAPAAAPEVLPAGTLCLRPFSPARGEVRVAFALPAPAAASLEVFDASGRRCWQMPEAVRGAGWHEVRLPSLTPGVYFCRLRSGDRVTAERLVVME